ncbi:MAG: type II secretion system F family protein, partial [Gemmatimonadaceae bacterium]
MPIFTYTARATNGDLKTATIEAASRDAVIAQLRKMRLAVVKIDENAQKATRKGSVKIRDIVVFTRQFSTMVNAGLPLVQALDILAKQTENKTLSSITRQVMFDVESGYTLADSMAKHPRAFTALYTNMVAAGEAGGILDVILNRLASFLEKNDKLIRKVKGAMIYPTSILAVAVGAIAILLIFVIPTFEDMFASVGVPLPFPTRIVIGMSKGLQSYWWAIIAFFVGSFFLLKRYYASPNGKLAIDRLLLKLPVLGDVLRKSSVSRFTRTLGTL